MPEIHRVKDREARWVRIEYENPAVVTRGGKLKSGTIHLCAEHLWVILHTVYGAARILRRSPVRVQQLCDRGQLRAFKIGRDWIILDNELKKFIRAQRAQIRNRYGAFLEGE